MHVNWCICCFVLCGLWCWIVGLSNRVELDVRFKYLCVKYLSELELDIVIDVRNPLLLADIIIGHRYREDYNFIISCANKVPQDYKTLRLGARPLQG